MKRELNYKKMSLVFLSAFCSLLIIGTTILAILVNINSALREDNKWRDYYGWYIKYEYRSERTIYPISSEAILSFQLIEQGGLEKLIWYQLGEDSDTLELARKTMDEVEEDWETWPEVFQVAQRYFKYGELPDFSTYTPVEYGEAVDTYIQEVYSVSEQKLDILWLIREVTVNRSKLQKQVGLEEGLAQAQQEIEPNE